LGKDFLHLQPLLIVLTVHLAVNMAVRPLFGLNIALNKVRVPGLVSLGIGLFNLLLAIVLVKAGWGVLGIALSGAVSMTVRNLLFTSIYAARIQELPAFTYLKKLMRLVFLNGAFIGLVTGVTRLIAVKTLPELALLAAAVSAAYSFLVYRFVLKREEKELLWKLLPVRMRPEFYENNGS
jgi:membrane protein EpsK